MIRPVSRHTPVGYIWPIGLIMQALTSNSNSEKEAIVQMLLTTNAGTGYMHESFHPEQPEIYTRAWFAGANSLFAGLLCQLTEE